MQKLLADFLSAVFCELQKIGTFALGWTDGKAFLQKSGKDLYRKGAVKPLVR